MSDQNTIPNHSPTLTPDQVRCRWQDGALSYRLRNIQKKIRNAWIKAQGTCQKFYIEGNRRLGKSSFLLNLLSEFCIKHPGSKAGFYAPVKEGLRDYIVPIIDKTFEDCPEELRPTLDAHLTLNFPNGSSVIFRGSNNQQHRIRRGNDLQIAAIDEARDVDDLDDLIDSVVIPSLFTTSGRLIISSTPADTEDHPLHAIRQAAEKEGWFFHCDIYACARSDPKDFPLDRIETWKKETTDETAWQREYLGLWVKDPTKIIIPEWSDDQVQTIPHDEYFPYYHKYAALDSGVRDKTAGIFGYYHWHKAKLVIEGEFALQDAEVRTDRIAEKVKSIERGLGYQVLHDRKADAYRALQMHEKMYRRVADNNNLILIQDMGSLYDVDFMPTHKDELPAMINQLREWVKDGRVIVDKSCPELRGCLRNAIWDKNKKELARSKVFGHFDALMALVYLVRNVDTNSNPIPKFYGKSWATHAGVPLNATDPQRAGDALARMFNQPTGRDEARKHFVRGNQSS